MGEPGNPCIPGYRIERSLGSGGMGQVYLARQQSLDRLVALKLLPAKYARDSAYVERFIREARSAGKLSHENIVSAVDVGEADGQYYFVMEYVPGKPLSDILRLEAPLPEKRALELARQIARGLKHAHAHGFIHRDIKPSNILLTPEGVAKICDLGLARQVGSIVASEEGLMHGTPAYASPEQCRGAKDVDHRADLYSLGITLFEMLTGQRPFHGGSFKDLARQQVGEEPPPPRSLNPSLSPAANALVLRLLRKAPEERYQECEELLGAIEGALKNPAPKADRPSRRIHPRSIGPRRLSWMAGGALAAGIAIVVVGYRLRGGGSPPPSATPSLAAPDTGADLVFEKALELESETRGRPAEYRRVRDRWKELEESTRGTPRHERFAERLRAFEESVAAEADGLERTLLREVETRVRSDHLLEALGRLGEFPEGFGATPAGKRVLAKRQELKSLLEDRFNRSSRLVLELVAREKCGEARDQLQDLRATVLSRGNPGAKGVSSEYEKLAEDLLRKIEEKELALQARLPKATAREEGPTSPPPPGDLGAKTAPGPANALESRKSPSSPLGALRQAIEEGDAAKASSLATLLQSNVATSPVYEAAILFLERGLPVLKKTGPLRSALLQYLSSPPLDHPEKLTLPQHETLLSALAEAMSALKDGGEGALLPFACAHLEAILSLGGAVEPRLAERLSLKRSPVSGRWGPGGETGRIEMAELLLKPPPAQKALSLPPSAPTSDFPSLYGGSLVFLRQPLFEVSAAVERFRRLAAASPDGAWAKMTGEIVERIRSAAVCEACGAQGKYACIACGGAGIAPCATCSGAGVVSDDCGGKVTCTDCKGRGQALCGACSGAKTLKCSTCNGKRARNFLPGGLFRFVQDLGLCAACSGQGSAFAHVLYPCPGCGGIGRVMSDVPKAFGKLPAWLKGPSGLALWNALRWLARHQSAKDSWEASGWPSSCPEAGCEKTPAGAYDVGTTSLALLAFLGAGFGRESDVRIGGARAADVVERATRFLLAGEKPDEPMASTESDKPVHEHLLALLALASASSPAAGPEPGQGVHNRSPLREGTQRALRVALGLQKKGGGWSYSGDAPTSDTWVTAWGALALLAAKDAGFEVPRANLDWVLRWLESVTDRNTSHLGEAPDRMGKVDLENTESFLPHETLSVAGGLLRLLIEGKASPPPAAAGRFLLRDLPAHDPLAQDLCYWYWGTAFLAHREGRHGALWSQWSQGVARELLPIQETRDTCALGSWPPKDRWGTYGGTVYATALAALTIEVQWGVKSVQRPR